MINLIVIAVSMLLVSWMGYFSYCRQQRQLRLRQEQGLEASYQLLELVRLVQQHRGVSSAILGGNENQRNQLRSIANDIDARVMLLQKSPLLNLHKGWRCSTKKWYDLRGNRSQIEVLENFENHCDLLAEFLMLIQEITDYSGLTSCSNKEHREIARKIFSQLPVLIENLGQLRALSTHAAASTECITAFRLHLQFLIEQISEQQHDLSDGPKITEVLTLISKRILQAERIDINPEELFSMISGVMESGYKDIEKGVQRLGRACG